VLRKGHEWEDFQLLTESKFREFHDGDWVAVQGDENVRWKDQSWKPWKGQVIHLTDVLTPKETSRREERHWRRIEAWERYAKNPRKWTQWDAALFEEDVAYSLHPYETDDEVAIKVGFPRRDLAITLFLPMVATWDHFKSFMNHHLGENEWCSGFGGQIWYNSERSPAYGEEVDVCWPKPDAREKAEVSKSLLFPCYPD
jgi:hypothetical protein